MAHYINHDDISERLAALEELMQKVESFRDSAYELDYAWTNATLPTEIDEMGSRDAEIPFTYSFDEWVSVLDDWATSAMADIERLIEETQQEV